MRIRLCLPLFLACSFCLPSHAQMPGIEESRFQIGSEWNDQIINRSTSSIVALEAAFGCGDGAAVTYDFDSVFFYGHDTPIGPKGIHSFDIPTKAAQCPGGVVAVIYSDGHTEGTAEGINEIYQHHYGASEELKWILKTIGGSDQPGYDPATIAKFLRERAKAIGLNTDIAAAERHGRMHVLNLAAQVLERQDEFLVPSDRTPSLRGDSIEDVVKKNNLSRPNAHAIVLRRKIMEWISALKTQLGPYAND